jgi:N-acetylglucosaminyl-diphospho-decaprenol L-rhamnosyltransferase
LDIAMSDINPNVAAVIVNYRTADLTLRCVSALAAERKRLPQLRAVIVDGGSGDGSAEMLRSGLNDARYADWTELLVLPINGGFGWANNQAMLRLLQRERSPDYIYLINPDAEIEAGALEQLLEQMERFPGTGACGSRLIDYDGTVLGSAFRFPTLSREFARGLRTVAIAQLFGIEALVWASEDAVEVDWVTGASVLFRSAALRQTGLFDDGFFLYYEEVELMWRLRRAGWGVRHAPSSRVVHVGGAATGVSGACGGRYRRLPDYWHHSRRRFFMLCYGRVLTVVAGISWLLGHSLWLLRGLAERRLDFVPKEGRDHVRLGLVPRLRDLRRSAPAWNSTPGAEPGWARTSR